MSYSIEVQDRKGSKKNYRLIRVSGQVSADEEEKFEEELYGHWKSRPDVTESVCLDFSATRHFTSSVLGEIVKINREHREAYESAPVSVVAQGEIREVFGLTKLDKYVNFNESLDNYLAKV